MLLNFSDYLILNCSLLVVTCHAHLFIIINHSLSIIAENTSKHFKLSIIALVKVYYICTLHRNDWILISNLCIVSHTLSLSPTYLATPMQAKLTFKLHKAKLMFKLHNQVQQNALFRTTEVLCRCWIKLRSGWGMAGFCVFIGVTCLIVLACDSLRVCTAWMWHCEHTRIFWKLLFTIYKCSFIFLLF